MRRSQLALRILSSVTDGGAAQLLPAAEAYHLSQTRHKVTGKTTTKSQRFQLAIKPQREALIRDFWEHTRGVTDLACQHRLANFARIYPRYRDLDYLRTFMPRWDSAIERIIAHDRGMVPANELARRHPFMLNIRLEPLRWAKLAVRGRLPVYTWNTVLADLKRATGTEKSCQTEQRGSKIRFKAPNAEWRSPGWEGCNRSFEDSEEESDEEDDEAWLEAADEAQKELLGGEHADSPDQVEQKMQRTGIHM